ncbi:hypothetical protein SAMN05216228_101658 [Rhizobium tibeticum]|uniref:Uncharacterized protein n=1 Tax=Rhizobium tibeticum TaxID=501024 RepID=A0A1H8P7N9_9HYPH|nr:hypothetical protein [Rhizobium tibeticum]SEI02167.1 hypothetical protein RTCCBAU85039_3765 [Rhizobium tibeticum]SEO37922.1 hypothetical protein SAMN05216228_101658 [Rhizobium tibeticum]
MKTVELAMVVDFSSSDSDLERYLNANEPVAILFEDADLRGLNRPPNLHLISALGLLRGLENVGVIASADEVIHEMLHPSKPGRSPEDARNFTGLSDGSRRNWQFLNASILSTLLLQEARPAPYVNTDLTPHLTACHRAGEQTSTGCKLPN